MTTRQTLKRFWQPAITQRRMYLIGMSVMASWFIFDVFSIWIFKYIGTAIENKDVTEIKRILIIYSVIFCLFYIGKYFIRLGGRATSRYEFSKALRKEYMSKFFVLQPNYVEKVGTGRTISLIQDGINNWIDALLMMQYEIPNLLIKVGFTLYLLWNIGVTYLLVFFILFIGIYLFIGRINKTFLFQLRKERKSISTESSRQLVRMIMAKQEVLYSNNTSKELASYNQQIEKQQSINYRITHYIYCMFNAPLIIVQGLSIITLLYAYISIRDGVFSLGLFSALLAMIGSLTQLMLRSTESYKSFGDQFVHIEKLREFFDHKEIIDTVGSGNSFLYSGQQINIKKINFSYESSTYLFGDFSLTIKGQQKTALVGPSGGGKSTLIKLIAGYLQPDSGSVLVDGQDLKDVSLLSYYAHVGYLTQEPSVFDGTIRENLEYGLPELDNSLSSQERVGVRSQSIESIITPAKCERIYDLPQGLDTEIGERGVRLSGGQKQRLAIAKIMLKNPDIILLDEPTSALDSENEKAVTEALNNLFKDKTVIIIAHRLQTVKHADDIIYIADGKVIERGTHDELLALGGAYYTMVELQSGF